MNVPLRPNKVQTAGAALILALAAYRRYMRYRAGRSAAPESDAPDVKAPDAKA
jgi:hypothetical protein